MYVIGESANIINKNYNAAFDNIIWGNQVIKKRKLLFCLISSIKVVYFLFIDQLLVSNNTALSLFFNFFNLKMLQMLFECVVNGQIIKHVTRNY